MSHATPAAFTAHAVERNMENFIAWQQLVLDGLDVIFGGGRVCTNQPLTNQPTNTISTLSTNISLTNAQIPFFFSFFFLFF